MAERTGIQWAHSTWNPWHGCIKVSAGCKNCYMYTEKKMYGQEPAAVTRSKSKFAEPLKWTPDWLAKRGHVAGEQHRVFTCSWSDFFIEQADEWRDEAWDVIRATPHLTYLILTKRPQLVPERLPKDWGDGWPHVWMGVSVEAPPMSWRINRLLDIPAAVRFLSIEPLLASMSLRAWPPFIAHSGAAAVECKHGYDACPICDRGIDWVIVGGESGPGSRACCLGWVRRIVGECQAAHVPVFVKQLGRVPVDDDGADIDLRDFKGGDAEEWPEDLRIREFPEVPCRA